MVIEQGDREGDGDAPDDPHSGVDESRTGCRRAGVVTGGGLLRVGRVRPGAEHRDPDCDELHCDVAHQHRVRVVDLEPHDDDPADEHVIGVYPPDDTHDDAVVRDDEAVDDISPSGTAV